MVPDLKSEGILDYEFYHWGPQKATHRKLNAPKAHRVEIVIIRRPGQILGLLYKQLHNLLFSFHILYENTFMVDIENKFIYISIYIFFVKSFLLFYIVMVCHFRDTIIFFFMSSSSRTCNANSCTVFPIRVLCIQNIFQSDLKFYNSLKSKLYD